MFEIKNKLLENNINDKKEEIINKDINEDNKKEIIESKNNKIWIKNRFMGIKVKYEII